MWITSREMQWSIIRNGRFPTPGLLSISILNSGHSLVQWRRGDEPYYPVNDEKNTKLYAGYLELAGKEKNVLFGGRLGQYRYYDMDKVIRAALDMVRSELAAE